LEGLIKKLEKLKAENNKLKAKGKRVTQSSSSEIGDSSSEEEVSNMGRKGRNKHGRPLYNSMSFNYNNLPNATAYTSVLDGNAPHFDGSNHNQWKHCMKYYLYSIDPEVW
jgi:hypothetical protein